MYVSLLNDLESIGYTVSYDTVEIGSLGHFAQSSYKSLRWFTPKSFSKSQLLNLFKSIAKVTTSCSHTIFRA